LESLPPHDNVTISFDLYVIQSWDGYEVGPDIWQCGVIGGQVLVYTSFAQFSPSQSQAYPGKQDMARHPARTGAVENNSLGYIFADVPMDSVYHFRFSFPHSADSIQLAFTGFNLQELDDVRVKLS
jgi:hypothetical protein